ncbi:MAG TPA: hypothetical protein DCZ91_15965 [Lachnospiraceae bacterium]|nr:hypothetical protein [Lachnospiraceae bacterium]
MKKIWLKRAVSVSLSLAMVLGLAGCGKGGNKMENAALAKEHVYKFQEIEIPDLGGDDYSVRGSVYRDGTIYLMAQVYHWSENSDDIDMKMLTMKDDGSNVQLVDIEIPDWRTQSGSGGSTEPESGDGADGSSEPEEGAGAVARTEGEGAEATGSESGSEGESESGAGTEGEDGAESGSEGESGSESGTEGEDGADVSAEAEIDDGMLTGSENNIYENSNYGNFVFGSDGMIYAMRNYYYEDYSSEEYTSVQKNYISCWNPDGSFAWEKELEGLVSEDEYIYVNTMTVSQDGTLSLLLSGDNSYIMTVDAQGNASERKPLPEDVGKIFNNYNSIMNKEDGSFLVIYNDESDGQKQYLVSYDPVTGQLGEPGLLPSSLSWSGYNTMVAGKTSDLVYSNSSGVYTYTAGAEDSVEKMNFINSDLNISYFNSLIEMDENTFIGVFNENYENKVKAGIFTYVDPKDIPDKAVLVLAGNYVGSDMKQRVVEFNRSSEEYRITIKEYDSYNSYDDYQAGYTQLNNDITTGSMPDIVITSGLPAENYVAKGLLADISKLIEEDEELSQVEYVQNVFDAYSVDGKLYYVIPYFNVNTVIGKKSIVGDRTAWTMADMKLLMETLPEGTNMFGEMTRDSFMYTMMDFCGADFIDVNSGKCDFDSQNFIDMMEYARTLPEELNEEEYGEDYWRNYESQYREDRTILRSMYIGSVSNVNYTVKGNFGEEVSFIGFPTESGMGAYVQAGDSYAISARSANIDGAWEFLRYYLTDEYQSELGWGMPIQKKYFMEKAQEATQRPYYLDENGEKVEYDDYYYINDEEIKLEPMTQEEVDAVVEYILSVNKCYYGNTDISNIISEEIAPYFTGQKSAQEVAKIIQSRAQIYVDERR